MGHPLVLARTAIFLPVAASHSRAVLSSEAVTTRVPSGEKAALETQSSWPRRTAISLPVAASHSRAVLSPEAVTTRVPSGEKAALQTELSWPRRAAIANGRRNNGLRGSGD